LRCEELRSRYPIRCGPCAGSRPVPSQSSGPGGRMKGGCADPSHSSPAHVSRPATERIEPRTSCLQTRGLVHAGVVERALGALGGSDARLVLGTLPYLSGVRALRPYGSACQQRSWPTERVTGVEAVLSAWEEFLSRRVSLSCKDIGGSVRRW
jgi:hypothetical protein